MTDNDFLQEIVNDPIPADKGVRFANLIIDILLFYGLIFAFYFFLGTVSPESFSGVAAGDDFLLLNIVPLFIYLIYFTLLEGLTKGRTIGKLITGTKAVKEDGSPITMGDALKRSLSRMVPFEPFSALGDRPWHDKWTNTLVVKNK